MDIYKFIDIINKNQGALMVIITLVYVVATVIICFANKKSADATKEQVEEQKKQFEESNRAFVTIDFRIIKDGLAVLCIQNIGKRIAKNVSVKISNTFIENIKDLTDKYSLNKICNSIFDIGIDQKWYVCIGSHVELKQISEEILNIELSYHDNFSNYHESISIDLKQYLDWALIYESPNQEIYNQLKYITKELKSINKSINKNR